MSGNADFEFASTGDMNGQKLPMFALLAVFSGLMLAAVLILSGKFRREYR